MGFKGFSKLTIYPKLVFSILSVIIPILMFSLWMNERGSQNVRSEIYLSTNNQMHFYVSSLENEMNRIIKQNYEYINDSDLQRLSTSAFEMNDYERTAAIRRLQSRLTSFVNSSLYVDDVEVDIPLIGRKVFSSRYEVLDVEQDMDSIIKLLQASVSPIVLNNNSLLVESHYPIFSTDPILSLKVHLSMRQLQIMLGKINATAEGGVLLMDKQDRWFLSDGIHQDKIPRIRELFARLDKEGLNHGQETVTIGDTRYLFVYERSEPLQATLLFYLPEHVVLGPLGKYRTWFWGLIFLSIIFVTAFSYWIFRLIHQPLNLMVRAFRKVETGDLNISLQLQNQVEFNYLYLKFNEMVNKLRMLIQEVYEQQIIAGKAELKQLQTQINPHFLYNTYFLLYQMAQSEEYDDVVRLSKYLGQYMQYITRNGMEDVLLEEEIKHAYVYIDIQLMRFSERISADLQELPDEFSKLRVPRLILQPIIENVFQHGLKDVESGGLLMVRFEGSEDNLIITVENNGKELTDAEMEEIKKKLLHAEHQAETTAIINIHRRLQIKFGKHAGISISRTETGFTRFSIILSMEENNV